MAGYIGKIEPYDEGQETWTSYQERLEEYFEVNDIADNKKVSALLTLLGGKTYSLLRNLTIRKGLCYTCEIAKRSPVNKTVDNS